MYDTSCETFMLGWTVHRVLWKPDCVVRFCCCWLMSLLSLTGRFKYLMKCLLNPKAVLWGVWWAFHDWCFFYLLFYFFLCLSFSGREGGCLRVFCLLFCFGFWFKCFSLWLSLSFSVCVPVCFSFTLPSFEVGSKWKKRFIFVYFWSGLQDVILLKW